MSQSMVEADVDSTGFQDASIENVVISTSVDQELDLEELAISMSNIEYDVENFPGIMYKGEKATCLAFRSGKIVTTGAKSIEGGKQETKELIERFDELGIDIGSPEFTVQNIVSSATVDTSEADGQNINLNAISIALGLENVEYEPEQFPALLYRMDTPDAVILLFGSGKCVITGIESPEKITEALRGLTDELEEMGLL